MKKQEMKTLLFDMLDGILSGTEFRLTKREDAFVKKFDQGREVLGLPLWDYHPQFQFSLNVCIRLDPVEDVYHRFSGSTDPSTSFTTITHLEHFSGGSGKYKASSEEEVNAIGRELSPIIREKILPFLQSHNNVNTLNKAVNHENASIDITQNPAGAMHAIILSRLANDPEFDRVVERHRGRMQLSPDANHSFNRLVDHLKA